MNFIKVIVLFTFSLLNLSECVFDLPAGFPKCYRNDPKLNSCMLKATNQVREKLRNGVPALNIPSITPLVLPEIIVAQHTESFSYKIELKNVVVTGLDSYQFSRFDVTMEQMNSVLTIPFFTLKADYELKGTVFVLRIKGKGSFAGNVTQCHIQIKFDLETFSHQNEKYFNAKSIKAKIDINNTNIHFGNLFEDFKELEGETMKMLDDNIELLKNEWLPSLENVVEETIEELVYRSIFRVPVDKLFPIK